MAILYGIAVFFAVFAILTSVWLINLGLRDRSLGILLLGLALLAVNCFCFAINVNALLS